METNIQCMVSAFQGSRGVWKAKTTITTIGIYGITISGIYICNVVAGSFIPPKFPHC